MPGEGFIVRTAAIGEKDEDLVGDVVFLRQLWEGIQAKAEHVPAPGLVWQDLRLLQKVMRDIFREEVSSFWVDDDAAYRDVMSFVENLHPEWSNRVKRFTSTCPSSRPSASSPRSTPPGSPRCSSSTAVPSC